MLICEECFADPELRAAVSANSTSSGECDICHTYGKLLDLSEFTDFFDALLFLFEPVSNGKTVVNFIQDEKKKKKNESAAYGILDDILKSGSYSFSITDSVDYNSDIKDRIAVWDRLKKSVKERSRFFTDMDDFTRYNYLSVGDGLHVGQRLYRSRITPAGKEKIKRSEMGCPPKELATAGRANPIGIPYLYLSDSAKTTYFEVRAVYLDKLSVGIFKIIRNQKLVDFVYDVNLYLSFIDGTLPLKEIIIKKKIIDEISHDLSKPLRRYDSELEYVPTQLICEYCLRELNADGISFDSSLYKGGRNYVLFDQTAAKCVRVDCHEITRIDIDRK